MSNPPNFAQAVDLSSLGKPKAVLNGPTPGVEVTAANLTSQFLPMSKVKPVILFCWSQRSAESVSMLNTMAELEKSYQGSWILGHVDIDAQAQVAQALQTQKIPYAVALIAEQIVPLFEQEYPEAQIRLVLDKVLTLAAEQGVGQAPVELIEPEEEEESSSSEEDVKEIIVHRKSKSKARKEPVGPVEAETIVAPPQPKELSYNEMIYETSLGRIKNRINDERARTILHSVIPNYY